MGAHRFELSWVQETAIKALVMCIMLASAIWCLMEIGTDAVSDKADIINVTAKSIGIVFLVLLIGISVLPRRLSANGIRFFILSILIWSTLVLDCVCIFYEGYPGMGTALLLVRYLSYLALAFTSIAYWVFVGRYCLENFDSRVPMVFGIAYLVIILTNPITGLLFRVDGLTYVRARTMFIIFIPSVFMAIYYIVQFCRYVTDAVKEVLLSAIYILHLAGVVLQISNVSMQLLDLSNLFSLVILYGMLYYNRGEKIAQRDIAIENAKMKPHFIFNSLGAIMCIEGNPPATNDALMTFSTYLRSNLDQIGRNEPVSFEEEMRNMESFVYLEKLRFKSRLTVNYDIRSTKFKLPAFSTEVLVENSIKHGILPRPEGGMVLVESWEDETGYYVRVSDDGVGYDTNVPMSTGRSHVGIASLRVRLAKMCGGTLTIESIVGKGTKATIKIPKVGEGR